MEEWRDIEGFDGVYQVSNKGNVRSYKCKNGKGLDLYPHIIKTSTSKLGYKRVVLRKNNKPHTYSVHRLVSMAFIQNKYNLPYVNHKDEDKSNNSVDNLEWCDAVYNRNYGTANERLRKKLINRKDASKKIICIETNELFDSISDAARRYSTTPQNISIVLNNKTINCKGRIYKPNTAAGLHWEYAS